jgi:tetratricopeptide (TPR) repeat protein
VPVAHGAITRIAAVLVLTLFMGAGGVLAGDPAKNNASQQMKWGYQAAKKGYWLEALDRFERANELTPNQPRVINNIAVALEASGRFEEARLTYETGLSIAPNDRVLRRNFSRFMEFYSAQVAVETEEEEAAGEAAKPEDEDGDDEEADDA